MTRKKFFYEKLYQNHTFGFEITKTLVAEYNTGFQKLAVYETPTLGKVLVLDGAVQITDLDEYVYHETMAHTAMFSHKKPEHVLIIGGGDCGVAREILKHKSVKSVHVVDIDPEVTRVAKKFFPRLTKETILDVRLTIHHEDGSQIDKLFAPGSFDIVCLDSTDETNVASPLFEIEYVKKIYNVLNETGVMIRLGGSLFFQSTEVKHVMRDVQKVFGKNKAKYILFAGSPVYGSPSAFILSWKKNLESNLHARFKRLNLETKWYTPEIHLASEKVPPIFLK